MRMVLLGSLLLVLLLPCEASAQQPCATGYPLLVPSQVAVQAAGSALTGLPVAPLTGTVPSQLISGQVVSNLAVYTAPTSPMVGSATVGVGTTTFSGTLTMPTATLPGATIVGAPPRVAGSAFVTQQSTGVLCVGMCCN